VLDLSNFFSGGRIEAPKAPMGWDVGRGSEGCPPSHWGEGSGEAPIFYSSRATFLT